MRDTAGLASDTNIVSLFYIRDNAFLELWGKLRVSPGRRRGLLNERRITHTIIIHCIVKGRQRNGAAH